MIVNTNIIIMYFKQHNSTILNCVLSCYLLFAGFSHAANAQDASYSELFKSSVLTPVESFTSDVEGPAVDKEGNLYAANYNHSGTIGIVTPEGRASVFLELPAGSIANGIRFDSHGNMIISDYAKHNIFKVKMASKKLALFINEPRMSQPNDIAIDSKNRIYASDPDFKARTGRVWRIDPNKKITLLDSEGIGPANGIEVSPDEKTLYVNASRRLWAYDLSEKGEVSNRRLLLEHTAGFDGMRCDIQGNLWASCIGNGTVAKISPEGNVLQEIPLVGKKPTNVAFGGKDGCIIYVTLMDQANIESFRVDAPGREWKMGCSVQMYKDRAVPQNNNGLYSISVKNMILEIDPAIGGRITSFKIDGKNFFTEKSVNSSNWGSTLWPSPQGVWRWPPSPELDNKPYSIVLENNVVKMVSQKDLKFGWIFTKEISGNKKAGSYTLKYTITNGSDSIQSVAPWEVSRVHINGLTFFPIGKGNTQGGLAPLLVEQAGICWFPYKQDKLPVKGDRQIYTDGSEGWLAQVNDGVILIKKFPDVPLEKNAPNTNGQPEGEIELFASGVSPEGIGYVEIEHQGAYEELQPGESTTWVVKWFLKNLPDNIKTEVGNKALVDYARKFIK